MTPRFRIAAVFGTLMFGTYVLMREYTFMKALRATHKQVEFMPSALWTRWTHREVETGIWNERNYENKIVHENAMNPYDRHNHYYEPESQPLVINGKELTDLQAHLFALMIGMPIVGFIFALPFLVRCCQRRIVRWWRVPVVNDGYDVPAQVVHVGGVQLFHQTLAQRRVRRQQVFGEV